METDEKNQDLAEGENAIKTKKNTSSSDLVFCIIRRCFWVYLYVKLSEKPPTRLLLYAGCNFKRDLKL